MSECVYVIQGVVLELCGNVDAIIGASNGASIVKSIVESVVESIGGWCTNDH